MIIYVESIRKKFMIIFSVKVPNPNIILCKLEKVNFF